VSRAYAYKIRRAISTSYNNKYKQKKQLTEFHRQYLNIEMGTVMMISILYFRKEVILLNAIYNKTSIFDTVY